MEDSNQNKIELEHQAAKLFMRLYEKQFKRPIRHIWHNQPAKPDVSCFLEGERLDLEIAHLYGNEKEAMWLLGKELDDKAQQELSFLNEKHEVHERLLTALNRILSNKSTKSYKSKRCWLVIRNFHPSWNSEIIRESCAQINVPKEHPFEQIWLIGDLKGESGLVRLA